MTKIYEEHSIFFKALSDPNRLMIIDMLSCGELCACIILLKLKITQPTLSHHMKILCDCGLVSGRKDGKWIYYSLNPESMQNLNNFLKAITTAKQNCFCYESASCC